MSSPSINYRVSEAHLIESSDETGLYCIVIHWAKARPPAEPAASKRMSSVVSSCSFALMKDVALTNEAMTFAATASSGFQRFLRNEIAHLDTLQGQFKERVDNLSLFQLKLNLLRDTFTD